MPLKIIRNDIVKMNTEAVVNTANDKATVGTGCDHAIYQAAGYEKLLSYRKEHIGEVKEGEVFITPAFGLNAKYIIHAVSPYYVDGQHSEEKKLRSCYRKSLKLAKDKGLRSISFPLISTGGFGYPKEEGMRIAVDEINAFLLANDMLIYLVVFDSQTTSLGKRIDQDLQSYIDQNYVKVHLAEEFLSNASVSQVRRNPSYHRSPGAGSKRAEISGFRGAESFGYGSLDESGISFNEEESLDESCVSFNGEGSLDESCVSFNEEGSLDESCIPADEEENFGKKADTLSPDSQSYDDALADLEEKLSERMRHMSDTYSEYLLYLIEKKGLKNADVWRNSIVDKKVFSKIKNNPAYHPNKKTALCLCIGARLNIDEARDLLARAGYALSPCDKTDIIFSYFIEKEIYDMIELDIQLEANGEACIIA